MRKYNLESKYSDSPDNKKSDMHQPLLDNINIEIKQENKDGYYGKYLKIKSEIDSCINLLLIKSRKTRYPRLIYYLILLGVIISSISHTIYSGIIFKKIFKFTDIMLRRYKYK